MSVRLNITMDDDVYARLKKEVPPKKLSAFISGAVRAKLYPDIKTLDAAYRAASKEQWRTPDQPLHGRYLTTRDFVGDADRQVLEDTVLTINSFFGWDFNSCESLRKDGVWHPIDFANPCHDSQVTSLHRHFPWLVKANLRWSIYCAVTKRKFGKTLDWEPFYAIAADQDRPYADKLRAYGKLAEQRFEADRFEEFCATHLPHLYEVAWEFFGTEAAKDAFRQKVAALYPKHEVEQFTELFWRRVQAWRADASAGT